MKSMLRNPKNVWKLLKMSPNVHRREHHDLPRRGIQSKLLETLRDSLEIEPLEEGSGNVPTLKVIVFAIPAISGKALSPSCSLLSKAVSEHRNILWHTAGT